jgi:hypothetical protein
MEVLPGRVRLERPEIGVARSPAAAAIVCGTTHHSPQHTECLLLNCRVHDSRPPFGVQRTHL